MFDAVLQRMTKWEGEEELHCVDGPPPERCNGNSDGNKAGEDDADEKGRPSVDDLLGHGREEQGEDEVDFVEVGVGHCHVDEVDKVS